MFDAVALAAVADELDEKILSGRVQEIVQLDALSFGIEIYANHARRYLYISAHPDDARVHLVSEKLRGSGLGPSPLLLLLRKYAENAFVSAVAQVPYERVLKIQFDHSVEGVSTLVVETIGRYSNLVMVDAGGTVLDALKRVGPQINRARVILPQHLYAPPPPQSKLSSSLLTADDLSRVLAENRDVPLWQVLVKSIAGVSPLLAREVEHRVLGVPGSSAARSILETLGELVPRPVPAARPVWTPTVAFVDGEPAAFAPYRLSQFADLHPFDSISVALESFYGALDSYAAAKEPLRDSIVESRDRLVRKRDALAQSLPPEKKIEQLRVSGEMILTYATQIKPGQNSLRAETETGMVEIALDPKSSAVENAQAYFREYRRARDAAARVPALLAAAKGEVEYADQMLNDLEMAENRAEIDAVVQAAREAGLVPVSKQRRTPAPSEPRILQSRDGFTILVGKNARQNEEITFRRARPDDLWLHARGVAGAHVVVVRAGRDVPPSTVEEAAALAAHYSQARGDSRAEVIVAPRRQVHRARGGRTGMVTVVRGESVTVTPL